MYFLLREVETDSEDNKKVDDLPPVLFRTFSLIPHFSLKPRHIPITNTILRELHTHLDPDKLTMTDEELWRHYFPNIDEAIPKKKINEFFGFIKTDGVSVSIAVHDRRKPIVPSSKDSTSDDQPIEFASVLPKFSSKVSTFDDHEAEFTGVLPTTPEQEGTLIVIDPGEVEIVTGIVGSDDRPESFHMSNGEYHHLRGTKRYQYHEEMKLTHQLEADGLEYSNYCSNGSSIKSTDINKVMEFFKHEKLFEVSVSKYYHQSNKYRNRRFTQYQKGQKALSALVNRILGKHGGNITVVVGDYDGSMRVKGRIRAPVASWKRLIATIPNVRLITVNEAFTSATCSQCHNRFMSEETMRDLIKVRGSLHRIRLCQQYSGPSGPDANPDTLPSTRCSSPIVWHRDVNACLNIRLIYQCLRDGLPRPDCFCHQAEVVDEDKVESG